MTMQNPSAFPRDTQAGGTPGMTLRDWFAGQFGGSAAGGMSGFDPDNLQGAVDPINALAKLSYIFADAMLAARALTNSEGGGE